MQNEVNETLDSLKDVFKEKILNDLKEKFDQFEDHYEAKQRWEDFSGLNRKTLKRYLEGKTTPLGNNILKVYSFIFEIDDDSKVFDQLPFEVKNFFEKNHTLSASKFNVSLSESVFTNPIKTQIFKETMNGNETSKSDLIIRFGSAYTTQAINELLEQNVLAFKDDNRDILIRGSVNTNFCGHDMTSLLKDTISTDDFAQRANNDETGFTSLYNCLNLSEEGLKDLKNSVLKFFQEVNEIEKAKSGNFQVEIGLANKILRDLTKEAMQ